MRVNARIDETTEQQLDYLTRATGSTVSQVLRDAIAAHHRHVLQQQSKPTSLLSLAGKGDSGIGDLSANYKRYVAEAIDAKFARGGHDKTPTQRRRAR